MYNALLATIMAHRALNHTVFMTLAERKYAPDVLARYLTNMATLCTALRDLGKMRPAFADWPYGSDAERFRLRSAYQALNYIMRREKHGDEQLNAMATLLAPAHRTDDPGVVTPGTRKAIDALRHRSGDNADAMLRALGGLFVTETAWFTRVTPGQVAAFVHSVHYGLTLDDVPYLKGLVSVTNKSQEAWMEWMVDKATFTHDEWQLVQEGALEMLDSLANFYDDLETILKDGNPA